MRLPRPRPRRYWPGLRCIRLRQCRCLSHRLLLLRLYSLEQLGSLLARLEVIDTRISKLIGHHFRDVNAELHQVLQKAGLLDDEVSADFG